MRAPRSIIGHLLFPADGRPVALWRVDPPAYAHLPGPAKVAWHTRSAAALTVLPGDGWVLGVRRPVNARQTAEKVAAGIDLDRHPAWAVPVRTTYERLLDKPSWERAIYLAAALPAPPGGVLRTGRTSAATAMAQLTGHPPALPSGDELEEARGQAESIEAQVAQHLGRGRLERVGAAEVQWLLARSALRGTEAEPGIEEFDMPEQPGRVTMADLGMPLFREGGDKRDRERHWWYPNYVRVDTDGASSYQAFLTLSRTPAKWRVPGGEFLVDLDETGVPLDWIVRVVPVPNAVERDRVRTKRGRLVATEQEFEGNLAGAFPEIPEAIDSLHISEQRLAENRGSPGVEYVPIIVLGAADLKTLAAQRDQLRTRFGVRSWHLQCPVGHQTALWDLAQPGTATDLVAGHYQHHGMLEDVAGYGPFTGSNLGDPQGAVIGMDIDTRMEVPVHFSASYGPAFPPELGGPLSGSIGLAGKVRSGKSQTAKGITDDVLRAGGYAATMDRTRMGEWAYKFTAALDHCQHEVIEVRANAPVVMDPLRIFRTPDERIRFGAGFLTLVTGTDPLSRQGTALHRLVTRVVAEGGCLADVAVAAMDGDVEERHREVIDELGGRLERFTTEGGLADVAFGRGRPYELGRTDYTCFWVPELVLPRPDQLERQGQLTYDHVLSLGLLYLVNAVCRAIAFSDRSRFCLVPLDECWYLARFVQGRDLMLDLGKNGPKENAGLAIITHTPSEIPPEIDDLLGVRMLFRSGASKCAEGLEWIGKDPTPANLELIDQHARMAGECLMQDRFGRVGLMRVREPYTGAQREAFDTSIFGVHEAAAEEERAAAAAAAPPSGRRRRDRVAVG